jgi:hypothetical protein
MRKIPKAGFIVVDVAELSVPTKKLQQGRVLMKMVLSQLFVFVNHGNAKFQSRVLMQKEIGIPETVATAVVVIIAAHAIGMTAASALIADVHQLLLKPSF